MARNSRDYHINSCSSDSSTSSSSSTNSDTPLKRFNRLLRKSVARHWGQFRKIQPALKTRGRSLSDNGLCAIVDNDLDTEMLVPIHPPRRSVQALAERRSVAGIPKLFLTSAGSSSAVALDELNSSGSDAERPQRVHLRVPTPIYCGSTGNFGTAAGPVGGAARSAPSTPLQLEPTTPRPVKNEKQSLKPLSTSVPSVRTAILNPHDAFSDASEGKAPSKARQKKFFRHFPQVGPEERVLNYYSCALVGDILLQGHLYITRNYFAFYSNVFGYITKLLIPTSSVNRVTKEKMARIIPNAVGVHAGDSRHVFGSLLSRDSTYTLMSSVCKMARNQDAIDHQELRISEAELDVSEYSLDETSSAGGDIVDENTPVMTASAAIIQPALLAGISPPTPPPRLPLALVVALLLLLLSATYMAVSLYYQQDELSGLSGSDIYWEVSKLHGKAAQELHAFLSTNLLLLSKVRQSLEGLSEVILKDLAQNPDSLDLPPNDTTLS